MQDTLTWGSLVIGAVSLYLYFGRRASLTQTQRKDEKGPKSLKELIGDGKGKGWKVCLTADVLTSATSDEAKSILGNLCSVCDVFVMFKGTTDDEHLMIEKLRGTSGLKRHHVLRCTSEKGYEAFLRQLVPTVLVSSKQDLCSLLARFIPYVVCVGESSLGRNVLDIRTVNEIPLLQ